MSVSNQPVSDVDREQHVEVVQQSGAYASRSVTQDHAAEQRLRLARVIQVIWLIFAFFEALIGIRVVLKLIGANAAAFFSQAVYSVTDLYLWPFAGITGTPGVGAYQLEISSILAMIVYALLTWGLTRLIWVLFYHPTTASVTTYREDRY